MAEYRLSPAAERDLEGIWKYTRRECRLEQAERYTDACGRSTYLFTLWQ